MVRAWDESYGFAGRFYARPEHAPVALDGRQPARLGGPRRRARRDVPLGRRGLRGRRLATSAATSTATTRTSPGPRSPSIRWCSRAGRRSAALTPFMQLHGRANLTPVDRPRPYRRDRGDSIATGPSCTTSSCPFFYSLAEEALRRRPVHRCGPSARRPPGPATTASTLGDALPRGADPRRDRQARRARSRRARAGTTGGRPGRRARRGGTDARRLRRDGRSRGCRSSCASGAIIPPTWRDAVTGLGTAASAGRLTRARLSRRGAELVPPARRGRRAHHDRRLEDGRRAPGEALARAPRDILSASARTRRPRR